jgi:outer membrane lipoprotein-sorting protein
MKTCIATLVCLVGVSTAMAASTPRPAAAPSPAAALAPVASLSAAQVAERNLAARGGLAAWRGVTAMTVTGDMDAGGKQDTKLPYVLTMKRPNLTRLEIKFQDQAAVQIYDGTQGWKLRPYLGRNDVEDYKPAELQSAAAVAELDGPLIDYTRKGTRIEMAGTEAVEGKPAYKLKLTMKNGEQSDLWIDAVSFLEVKADGAPRRIDGKMHKVWVYYRDFRKEGGLMIAHTQETAVEGVKQTHKMTVKTVALNPPTDAATFAKPQPGKTAM